MSTVNLRQYIPHLIRHINRPDPSPVMRSKCDIVIHHDSDTVSLEHLTRREAETLYELCQHSPRLFAMTYALGVMLDIDKDEVA